MIKQSTVMCVLQKRAFDLNVNVNILDAIKNAWNSLSEDQKRGIKYAGIGGLVGLYAGGLTKGFKGALIGVPTLAALGYGVGRWGQPYAVDWYKKLFSNDEKSGQGSSTGGNGKGSTNGDIPETPGIPSDSTVTPTL